MTLNELNEIYALGDKIKKAEQLLESLWDKAGPQSPALTGMPHGSGVSDKVGNLAAEITDLEARIDYLRKEQEAASEKVEIWINSIEDPIAATMLRLRYLRIMTWGEVADIVGNYISEDTCKKTCYKYFDAQ